MPGCNCCQLFELVVLGLYRDYSVSKNTIIYELYTPGAVVARDVDLGVVTFRRRPTVGQTTA